MQPVSRLGDCFCFESRNSVLKGRRPLASLLARDTEVWGPTLESCAGLCLTSLGFGPSLTGRAALQRLQTRGGHRHCHNPSAEIRAARETDGGCGQVA